MTPVSRSGLRSSLLSVALIALAGLAAAAALLAGFTRYEVVNADRFSDRAVNAVVDSPARQRLAAELTGDLIVKSDGELIAFRPLIEGSIEGIIGSQPFRGAIRNSVADLHRTVVAGRTDTTTILLSDIGVLVASAVRQSNPSAARQIPAGFGAGFNRDTIPTEVLDQVDAATWLSDRFFLLAGVSLLLMAAGFLLAPSRRRAAGWVALGFSGGGVIVIAISLLAGSAIQNSLPEGLAGDLVGPIADSFLGALLVWGIYLAGTSLVVYAALASLIRPAGLLSQIRSGWNRVSGPVGSPWLEGLRAIALVAIGVLVIWGRDWIWELFLIGAGGLIILFGFERLFAVIGPAPEEEDRDGSPEKRPRTRRRLLVTGTAAALALLLTSGLFASGTVTPPAAIKSEGCNGHRELCDRPLNEVAFAMTHNSMSGGDIPGWLFAQQETGLPGQLEDGIRGLMLDVHYGREVSQGVRTEMDRGKMNRELEELFGVQGTAAVERLRNRLVGGGTPGPREVWLCHSVCEVGAMRFEKGLEQIRNFLARNPREVLVLIVQDEGVSPSSVEKSFQKSGLLPYVSRADISDRFPTLGQMVESGGRLLVFAENETSPKVPWYHPAFESIKETPYHFTRVGQMSCAANRGPEGAPLFLINNWIDSSPAPRPSNARQVNSREFLSKRVRECEKERGSFPNFVAVDFYREGDLFGVVDRLNGLGG